MIELETLPEDQQEMVKAAQLLDVWRKSDHPDLELDILRVWEMVRAHRIKVDGQIRIEARYKRISKAILLDLWIASEIIGNPFRSISKNKNDYIKGTRNRKIHWKYTPFVNLIDSLDSLGLITQVEESLLEHRRTRIAATPELIGLLKNCSLEKIGRATDFEEDETIRLKDAEKRTIDYKDTPLTKKWRKSLQEYNDLVEQAIITADVDYKALAARLKKKNKDDEGRRYIDPTRKRLYRVFNNGSWLQGGRFYGGFYQHQTKAERKTIRINGNPTCELDYKCHHARLLYILAGLPIPEDDLYQVEGIDREDVKATFLVLFNCESRKEVLNTMRSEKHIKNSEKVLQAIEKRHAAIAKYFYSSQPLIMLSKNKAGGQGASLQFLDSAVTNDILWNMTQQKIVVLPVHDSYIVEEKYKEVLQLSMNLSYQQYFEQDPVITEG